MKQSRSITFTIITLSVALNACEHRPDGLPGGAEAYRLIPPENGGRAVRNIAIGPLDVLKVRVFQEPDLSFDEITVDADGAIAYPLVGRVPAAGKSPSQLATDLQARLSKKYVNNAQVSIEMVNSFGQRVAVEGLVNAPGIFPVRGASTLLEMLALAKSPTEAAALDEVVVFRFINGQRTGAVFDVRKIRAGKAPNPVIEGGDTIVVGFSEIRATLRTFLQAVPAFAIFRPF